MIIVFYISGPWDFKIFHKKTLNLPVVELDT